MQLYASSISSCSPNVTYKNILDDRKFFFLFNNLTHAPNDNKLTLRPVRPKFRYSISSLGLLSIADITKEENINENDFITKYFFVFFSFSFSFSTKYCSVVFIVIFNYCLFLSRSTIGIDRHLLEDISRLGLILSTC
jgi:hypothetical protein